MVLSGPNARRQASVRNRSQKMTIFTSRLPLNSAKTAATDSLLLAVGAEAVNFSLGKSVSVQRGSFFVRFQWAVWGRGRGPLFPILIRVLLSSCSEYVFVKCEKSAW